MQWLCDHHALTAMICAFAWVPLRFCEIFQVLQDSTAGRLACSAPQCMEQEQLCRGYQRMKMMLCMDICCQLILVVYPCGQWLPFLASGMLHWSQCMIVASDSMAAWAWPFNDLPDAGQFRLDRHLCGGLGRSAQQGHMYTSCTGTWGTCNPFTCHCSVPVAQTDHPILSI